MSQLSNIENKLEIVLPSSYKNTINKFQLFMEIEFNNYQINLFNEKSLFDDLNGFPQWSYLEYLVEINKEKQLMPNVVERHDLSGYIDSERVKRGLMFGSLADGACVYFDLEDGLSIWEYWLDDGSIGKIADNFDEILSQGDVIDFE
ncbi:SMI1/KNR4 family protein [Neisseria zalophi]|uniref:SMI1/KNR4 family protein n=1 Tax=Neisseria zalophi TaxID=640030 RepID=A0A5J6PTY9_9NEIS|nr:SMI1/KNR4 family protein [Neisseria zalophi]QEY26161.1 SMI1/KNR4 family protein [Neisseria zalophi]